MKESIKSKIESLYELEDEVGEKRNDIIQIFNEFLDDKGINESCNGFDLDWDDEPDKFVILFTTLNNSTYNGVFNNRFELTEINEFIDKKL